MMGPVGWLSGALIPACGYPMIVGETQSLMAGFCQLTVRRVMSCMVQSAQIKYVSILISEA